MTHEEALSKAIGPNGAFASQVERDRLSSQIAAYLEARGAVLCEAEPVAYVCSDGPEYQSGSFVGHRGGVVWNLATNQWDTASVPLHAALSDNPKGETP